MEGVNGSEVDVEGEVLLPTPVLIIEPPYPLLRNMVISPQPPHHRAWRFSSATQEYRSCVPAVLQSGKSSLSTFPVHLYSSTVLATLTPLSQSNRSTVCPRLPLVTRTTLLHDNLRCDHHRSDQR